MIVKSHNCFHLIWSLVNAYIVRDGIIITAAAAAIFGILDLRWQIGHYALELFHHTFIHLVIKAIIKCKVQHGTARNATLIFQSVVGHLIHTPGQ